MRALAVSGIATDGETIKIDRRAFISATMIEHLNMPDSGSGKLLEERPIPPAAGS